MPEEGASATKLRVTHDTGTERVLRVREIRGKRELPSSVAAFDKLMARTSFAPDENEAEIAKQKSTCLVGDQQLDCEKTDYRVKIGDQTATFSIARSSDGRDVSGEISDASGKIIYKSELIESRSGLPMPGFAKLSLEALIESTALAAAVREVQGGQR